MKMLVVMFVLALAACSPASPAEQAHSVDDYLADSQLSADTIEACRGRNEAEVRVMGEKPACRNVWAAERQRWNDAVARSTGDWNDRLRTVVAERREAGAEAQGVAW